MLPAVTPDIHAPLHEWAQWYAHHGWPVFPCRGKAPLTPHGFHDASDEPWTIDAWWRQYPDANIGSPMGHGRWALDEDPRNGGDDTLFELERRYGLLPHTLLSHSGGGGCHFVWDDAGHTITHQAWKGRPEYAGLDIIAEGGYIILPPSIHPTTGKPYCWDLVDGPDDITTQPAPDWLQHLVGASTPKASPSHTAPLAAETPILEGSRNATLAARGAAMAHLGFRRDAITAALLVLNQQCCQPPLSQQEVERIAASTARYIRPTMNSVQRIDHVPVFPSPSQNGSSHGTEGQWGTVFDFSKAIPANDLLKTMMIPPRFLVEKLVPDGLTILAAPAKSYKSYFSLSLALATVGEGDWCEAFPVEDHGPVVFFGLEAPAMQLRNRLHQLRPQYQPDTNPNPLIFFSGMMALPTFKNGLQNQLEQIIDHYQPRLIIIDPLSYLYRLGRQDDLASATLDLLWPLAEMASKNKVAIFAPEHMRKRSKEDVSVVDQLAGSHIKAAIVHSLLMVHREGDDIIMETTLRDAASQELALTLTFDETQHRVIWGYKGANAILGATRAESIKTKALEELRTKRYPMKVVDIMTSLGLPATEQTKSTLRSILYRAEQAGDVAVSKRGEYYWIGQ